MEEKIENYIDSSLENIAPFLHLFSIIGGVLLIITGLFLIVKTRETHNTKKKAIGMTCLGIGSLATFSSFIQYVL